MSSKTTYSIILLFSSPIWQQLSIFSLQRWLSEVCFGKCPKCQPKLLLSQWENPSVDTKVLYLAVNSDMTLLSLYYLWSLTLYEHIRGSVSLTFHIVSVGLFSIQVYNIYFISFWFLLPCSITECFNVMDRRQLHRKLAAEDNLNNKRHDPADFSLFFFFLLFIYFLFFSPQWYCSYIDQTHFLG